MADEKKRFDDNREVNLSIIIPQYQETKAQLFCLLSSINNQLGLDFSYLEVIIVHDGNEMTEDLEAVQDFEWNFEIIIKMKGENVGTGMARQAGIDSSRGAFLMFADADDVFFDVSSIVNALNIMQQKELDLLTTTWIEEKVYANGVAEYKPKGLENTWMHGKTFRKDFLTEHNVRFKEGLRVHEDTYFLAILNAYNPKRFHADKITTYVWKYNNASTTRKDGALYTFSEHNTFIDSCMMVFSDVEKINVESMPHRITQYIYYHYYFFNGNLWQTTAGKKWYPDIIKRFLETLEPFYHYYLENSKEDKIKTFGVQRNKSFRNGIEKVSFYDWLAELAEDYSEGAWLKGQPLE